MSTVQWCKPSRWEKREGSAAWPLDVDLARWKKTDFWDLLTTIDYVITSQPLGEVIPLLRCLIDRSRDAPEEPPEHVFVQDHIVSLLYYAWDRAQEVDELRHKLREAHARLLSFAGGSA